MIPTVLAVAFLVGLCVPQRRSWWLGSVAVIAIAWGMVIMFGPDAGTIEFTMALVFGAANAGLGIAIGALVRWGIGALVQTWRPTRT